MLSNDFRFAPLEKHKLSVSLLLGLNLIQQGRNVGNYNGWQSVVHDKILTFLGHFSDPSGAFAPVQADVGYCFDGRHRNIIMQCAGECLCLYSYQAEW